MQSKLFNGISMAAVIIFSIFVLIWIGTRAVETTPFEFDNNVASTTDIKTPKGTIHATVASTSEDSVRGLSGRLSIPKDSGMLFVFSDSQMPGFWMKDMNFPIDIVWIAVDKKVSGILPDVKPETYPEVFYPTDEIGYVLELNSGGAKEYGIATGTKLVF
ncbi:MAG: DUF192 domain-containing protein [Candidatus Taylorbacteria bacterium]|nr:DUF192 domain-containing protein [Candidatus Taylorbacteria bacterium]